MCRGTGFGPVAVDRDGVTRGGFSLLELVLVTAILAVVSAIAIPRYGSAATRYQADLAARRVAADLRQAQAHAKTTGASCTVVFSIATGSYYLVNVPSLDRSPGDYAVDLTAEPYRAQLVSASFNGAGQVVFNGWGLPDNAGRVVVAVGSQQKTILVDHQTGQISIQGDP